MYNEAANIRIILAAFLTYLYAVFSMMLNRD